MYIYFINDMDFHSGNCYSSMRKRRSLFLNSCRVLDERISNGMEFQSNGPAALMLNSLVLVLAFTGRYDVAPLVKWP